MLYCLMNRDPAVVLGTFSLRLMTSQFNDIVDGTQQLEAVKCIYCGVWVEKFESIKMNTKIFLSCMWDAQCLQVCI